MESYGERTGMRMEQPDENGHYTLHERRIHALVKMWCEYKSPREIAEKLNITKQGVAYICKKIGLKPQPRQCQMCKSEFKTTRNSCLLCINCQYEPRTRKNVEKILLTACEDVFALLSTLERTGLLDSRAKELPTYKTVTAQCVGAINYASGEHLTSAELERRMVEDALRAQR